MFVRTCNVFASNNDVGDFYLLMAYVTFNIVILFVVLIGLYFHL